MGLISGLFDSAGDFAGAAGDLAEASAYGTAAKYANENAVIAAESGRIKLAQTNRQVFQVLGAQQADYAGNGLRQSGSAADVYRNSVQQGSLQKAIVQEQTQINVTGYQEQASAFKGMQSAADAAAVAGAAKGVGDAFKAFGL